MRYSTVDRELLAAYLSVLHFRHLIEGRQVLLLTDHKPLCGAFYSLNPAKSDRQQRQLAILTEFISDIEHVNGSQNIVADCLSRPTLVQIDACDLPALAEAQASDTEIQSFCDLSTSYPRPFVPCKLRESIFYSIHSINHPGIKSSIKMIKAIYYWPNMDKSIKEFCTSCTACQQAKVYKHTKSPIQTLEISPARFHTVHIDILGPLPPAKSPNSSYIRPYRYSLTCIDRTTRWIEAQPISEITASSVAEAFINTWVTRWGVPLHVITDRGRQLESKLFSEVAKIIGFYRLRTTAYHPQCNGLIERMHRTVAEPINMSTPQMSYCE